mmetsp:Transcript_68953/g.165474  ORF Transcript_68953/g.165474 Transcript_68953/m.165474 type:complete len:216 (-) Transcript_68953:787-1434(-)
MFQVLLAQATSMIICDALKCQQVPKLNVPCSSVGIRSSPLRKGSRLLHLGWSEIVVRRAGIQMRWDEVGSKSRRDSITKKHHATQLDTLTSRCLRCCTWICEGRVNHKTCSAIFRRVEALKRQSLARLHAWIVDPPVLLRWDAMVNFANTVGMDALHSNHILGSLRAPLHHCQWVPLDFREWNPQIDDCEAAFHCRVNPLCALKRGQKFLRALTT